MNLAKRYEKVGENSYWDSLLQGGFSREKGKKVWHSGAGFGNYKGVFGPGTPKQRAARLREGELEKEKYLARYAFCKNCGHSKSYHVGATGPCRGNDGCGRYR